MCRLVESIRILDGSPVNLQYHQARVDKSCRDFLMDGSEFNLGGIIDVPGPYRCGTVKCRFLYGAEDVPNIFSLEFAHYKPRSIDSLKLVEADLDYSFKHTDRASFDLLLKERGGCDDVLIVKNGRITDTSFSNIVFRRAGQWFTPSLPLLMGTARSRLLESGLVSEAEIRTEDLGLYDGFRLINAMLPFSDQMVLPMGAIV